MLAAALRIQPTPEHPMLLDGWVARYVFDYRLPPGSLDLASGTRFPGMTPGAYKIPGDTSPQLRPEDIFVVGNYMLKSLKKYTYLEHADPPTWNAFGIKQLPYDKYPRWVYIISAKSCKDVRVDAAEAEGDHRHGSAHGLGRPSDAREPTCRSQASAAMYATPSRASFRVADGATMLARSTMTRSSSISLVLVLVGAASSACAASAWRPVRRRRAARCRSARSSR